MDVRERSYRRGFSLLVLAATSVVLLVPLVASAQELAGSLIGVVRDSQGGSLPGAQVRVSSPGLIGGPLRATTTEKGQFRFQALPPGRYVLEVEHQDFALFRERDVMIDALATLERTIELQLAGLSESVVVEGVGSRVEARAPGMVTRFRQEDLRTIPTRRASMFDWIRAAPGILPTSPSGASGPATTVSAFGSGVNENQFLIDGTNTTCPCNGVARSEPGNDFIQDVQVQSIGASAEFGSLQGAVINVITRQGSDRFQSEVSYFGQASALTSQPVRRTVPGTQQETGYSRDTYRDVTPTVGGPVIRERLWFFSGYEYLRDYDSQPGTNPDLPRQYEQNKFFTKLTWRLTPRWQMVNSVHYEDWINPDQPTIARPFETTLLTQAKVPSITLAQLTHTASANTVWDMRAGRFTFKQTMPPASGDLQTASRLDLPANRVSLAPPQYSNLSMVRTTAKATVTHYRAGVMRTDQEWKIGMQLELGEHQSLLAIPTGTRYVYSNGRPSQSLSSAASSTGGRSVTLSGFANDAITFADRVTVNAGVRFDHSRAISQDLHGIDRDGAELDEIVDGRGTLYTWNVWSPRLGLTAKLRGDGRTMLRGSYGRFHQGVLTGEIGSFHPGATPVITRAFVAADNDFTRVLSVVDPRVNLLPDPNTRAPRTDEYSIGIDREIGRHVAVAAAYIHKEGRSFIGWTDVAGVYQETSRTLADGRAIQVLQLISPPADRRFLLTNADGYSLTYRGLVLAAEKRLASGWQMFGSYTFSRTAGLLASSGTTAGGAQASSVAPPPAPGLVFGRDPNDLTNARGRLANDRPHVLRVMGSADVPKTGLLVAANFGYFTGKPWAAITQVATTQNNQQRVQLEPRGSRRLSSQSLLDVRVSRTIATGRSARIELLVDVLNVLNDAAEESLVSEILTTETIGVNPDFGKPNAFIDPRRAMIGVRVGFGR